MKRSISCHFVPQVIAGHPALELSVRLRAHFARLSGHLRIIERELENHVVGVGHVYRAAVAVLEYVHPRLLVARGLESLLDPLLRFLIHIQRDVTKRRCRQLRPR